LSQDNESIGFFLSAGCPLAVAMEPGKWPLIPDVENLTKYVTNEMSSDPTYGLLLDELVKAGRNKLNVEDILSFMRSLALVSKGATVRGLTEDQLIALEKTICKTIVAKINVDLPTVETPYHRLSNWIRSIERKTAIEIFTTNYDLLVEQGLESAEVPYFDGFVGSRRSFFDLRALEDNLIPKHWTRLWKIHGSINWYQEEVSDLKKVYRSSEIKDDAAHLIYPSHLKYEESRKMPYLALVDQLNRFIRKKSSLLIICGYSFNDGHLNDCICSALKANPTAMVLALMFDTYEKDEASDPPIERYPAAYRLAKMQHNLNVWTYDKAVIGTNLGKWGVTPSGKDDPDPDLLDFVNQVDATYTPGRTTVKLGDFEVFSQFLKRIIGAHKAGVHG
jgi:hypothetical protein